MDLAEARVLNDALRAEVARLTGRETELSHEVRRLRLILEGIAHAGGGIGAVVECYAETHEHAGFAVCRGDGDEMAFALDIREAVERFASYITGERMRMKSVSTKGTPTPEAPR